MAETINAREPRKLGLLTIPDVAVSMLPILACSLCWPAYAALISSLGLGFLASSTYLLLIILSFLYIGRGQYAVRKRERVI